jgi:antitoxin component YwqK of YwqJK toxin-antitoxin module
MNMHCQIGFNINSILYLLMNIITEFEQKYPLSNDHAFVSFGEWIIICKKLENNSHILKKKINSDIIDIINEFIPQTTTDELQQSNINDPQYAEFHANVLLIINFINKFTGESINKITYKNITLVKEGFIDRFDFIYLYSMCSYNNKSICYFKSFEAPFYNGIATDNYTGPHKKWHENGQLREECTYKDGKKDGLYRKWYKNDQPKKECIYKDNELDGLYKSWHENGQLHVECTYKNRKLDGLYKMWYFYGQLEKECTCNDGKLYGLYKEWFDDGRLKIECTYKDGNLMDCTKEGYRNGYPEME